MTTTQINSPQYAGFWLRLLASLIDSILLMLVIVPILMHVDPHSLRLPASLQSQDLLVYLQQQQDAGQQLSLGHQLFSLLINIGLPAIAFIVFWCYRSATPGKMILKLKIIDAHTGQAPSVRQCIIRYLGYYVSLFGLGFGFISIAFDPKKQGWHDKMAHTVVIRQTA